MFDVATLWGQISLAIALALTGALGGFIGGLLGVGGGIVIVPVLSNALIPFGLSDDVRLHLTIGTSLSTIILTSLSSARAHWKRGNIDRDLLRSWGPSVLVGAVVGGGVAAIISGNGLALVFGVIALVVAAYLAFMPEGSRLQDALPRTPLKEAIAGLIGIFSVLMGIGGGTLSVPVLSLFGYPIRRAVGTASAIGLIIAVPGTIGFLLSGLNASGLPPYSLGYVSLPGLILIAPLSMLLAPHGARIASTIKPGLLRRIFALFLVASATKMLLTALG